MSYLSRAPRRRLLSALVAATVVATAAGSVTAPALGHGRPDGGRHHRGDDSHHHSPGHSHRTDGSTVRFSTFNASLNRASAGELEADLSTPDDEQAATVAEILQRTRPDVVLLNEFDYVPDHRAIDLFRQNYLEQPHNGAAPIRYRYAYVAPSNTGVPSGKDLDNDGTVGGGNDAFGFGLFEGQYGMAVLSRYPIDTAKVRTFQKFLWKDMPGALLPDDPTTPEPADWYSPDELDVVRLSSKSHWDVPVRLGHRTVHFLVSHPTPPTFDGDEDRNGTRNHDEIRFWADYVAGGRTSRYMYDDRGHRGGLPRGADFVIAGDQNSDPNDGDSVPGAIQQLIDDPRIVDPMPTSEGAVEAAETQGGANDSQISDPKFDTADFSDDPAPGNLRADYVLPSHGLPVVDTGVFWPDSSNELSRLTGVYPFPSSDHRTVWLDVRTGRGRH